MTDKPKILIFIDWFLPAYKAGGPITAIKNFIDLLYDTYDIYIYTSDTDLQDQTPLSGIRINQWNRLANKCSVFYARKQDVNIFTIKNIIKELNTECIYINGLFSYKYAILPILVVNLFYKDRKTIITPRGVLKESALKGKYLKKMSFICITKFFKFYKNIFIQATDNQEYEDCKKYYGNAGEVFLLQDIPLYRDITVKRIKNVGSVNLMFLGRIHPIKGLDLLLKSLRYIDKKIHLYIIGTEEDGVYTSYCKKLGSGLSPNLTIEYSGGLPFQEIEKYFFKSHFLVSPTQGENFGHAIFEGMMMGLPVLISDQTPWKELEKIGVGWNVADKDIKEYARHIENFIEMNQSDYNSISARARQYALEYINSSNLKGRYISAFSCRTVSP